MRGYLADASERQVRVVDGLVLFWVVAWLVAGAVTGYSVWQLSSLGDTLGEAGGALDQAGDGLVGLGQVPVVGERSAELGQEVRQTAAQVEIRGEQTRVTLRRLGVLLGLAVALVPLTWTVLVYLPDRLRREQERREVARFLSQDPDDALLRSCLALRAVQRLSYRRLREIAPENLRTPDDCGTRELAEAELVRLGLVRPGRTS
jgi:hypothetical protein